MLSGYIEPRVWPIEAHLSLRSTGDLLSNLRFGSLRIVFQLPTPCYESNVSLGTKHEATARQAQQPGNIKKEKLLTILQPVTSICVSSSDHFFRCFFSRGGSFFSGPDGCFLDLPLFSGTLSVSGTCESTPVSSRKSHATFGVDGSARETLRCFSADVLALDEEEGNGALKEKEVEGT
jgi:hypothetical protein